MNEPNSVPMLLPKCEPLPTLLKPREIEPTTLLELETSPRETTTATLLPEEELLTARPLPERTSVERLLLLLLTIRIIAPVKPRSQFRIAQHFVSLVDLGHLLLRLILQHAPSLCFIRVELSRQRPVGALDGTVVGVVGYAKNLVVILRLGTLEADVGFLVEELDLRGGGVMFFCLIEGVEGGFEGFFVDLALGEEEETIERIGILSKGLRAVR